MYIVKATQGIETISLPSTYELTFSSLFLQIKQFLNDKVLQICLNPENIYVIL